MAAMKVNIEIECTPEEARTFLGLPDLKPMQEVLLAQLQERMMANIRSMDPQEVMKTWFGPGMESFGNLFARMSGNRRE